MHLMGREANKSHERRAGRLLTHSTIADAGAISRTLGSIANSAALAATDIFHGLFPRSSIISNDDRSAMLSDYATIENTVKLSLRSMAHA